jgi:hypothetical protein
MTHTKPWLRLALAVAVVAFGSAGCGGGSDDDEPASPPEQQVPASASASIDNFIGYLKSLIASNADTLEPVDVGGVTPPVDETSEPQKVE